MYCLFDFVNVAYLISLMLLLLLLFPSSSIGNAQKSAMARERNAKEHASKNSGGGQLHKLFSYIS